MNLNASILLMSNLDMGSITGKAGVFFLIVLCFVAVLSFKPRRPKNSGGSKRSGGGESSASSSSDDDED